MPQKRIKVRILTLYLYPVPQSKFSTILEDKQPSITLLNMDLEIIDELLLPLQLKPVFFFRSEAIYAAVLDKYLPDEDHLRFRPIYVEWE